MAASFWFLLLLFCCFRSSYSSVTRSPGATVTLQSPFFLFASENVFEVILKAPTCLFVSTASYLDLEKLTFTTVFPNKPSESMSANEFLNANSKSTKNGRLCFADDATSIRINRGDIFDGIDDFSNEWRSTVMLFLAKSSLQGQCAGMGDLGGNVITSMDSKRLVPLNISSECPAYFLSTSNVQNEINQARMFCAMNVVALDPSIKNASIPSNVGIDVETIQSGVKQIKDVRIFSINSQNTVSKSQTLFETTILRSAFVFKTNSSQFVSKPLVVGLSSPNDNGMTAETLGEHVCELTQFAAESWIDSNPYSDEQFVFNMGLMLFFTSYKFEIGPYDPECVNLTMYGLYWSNQDFNFPNVTGTIEIRNVESVMVEFLRYPRAECKGAQVRFHYLASVPPEPTVPPTTTLAPTTSTASTTTTTATEGRTTVTTDKVTATATMTSRATTNEYSSLVPTTSTVSATTTTSSTTATTERRTTVTTEPTVTPTTTLAPTTSTAFTTTSSTTETTAGRTTVTTEQVTTTTIKSSSTRDYSQSSSTTPTTAPTTVPAGNRDGSAPAASFAFLVAFFCVYCILP